MLSRFLRVLPQTVTDNLTAAYFKTSAWAKFGSSRQSHSINLRIDMSCLNVKILSALSDNYMYLIIDPSTKEAAIVDPVDPESVIAAVKTEGVKLSKVLTTHHHWDHAGGNEKLVSLFTENKLEVFGGDERIGALTNHVKHGDTLKIGNLDVECLHTPCHTSGHICYYVSSPFGEKAVFTGDTLFLGGCGRFFEGTAEQMYEALIEKLSKLPDETKVFCGHEYAKQNLLFGLKVEPENVDIRNKLAWVEEVRGENIPSVPSSIGEEKKINPFMRVNEQSLREYTKSGDGISAMGVIRKEKDSFKA
ncbi:hydroxyacylglutathione hydrolase, mitochondrial-like [Culicoides brevitarsis]|uniref:hydroxyacylglutathione hydrolase, mitochondrial-like n=1 Tax=Culicoides brevitarsis TaxID=469753 RepID=UPI00307C25DD